MPEHSDLIAIREALEAHPPDRNGDAWEVWKQKRAKGLAALDRLAASLENAERERARWDIKLERAERALEDRAERAEAERDRYKEALTFYAKQRGLGSVLASDGGMKARAALDPARSTEEEADLRSIYCTHCHKTHTVVEGEEECSPGAWLEGGQAWPADKPDA